MRFSFDSIKVRSTRTPRLFEVGLAKEANDVFGLPYADSFITCADIAEIPQSRKRNGEDWTAMLNPTAENIIDLCDIGTMPCQRSVRRTSNFEESIVIERNS